MEARILNKSEKFLWERFIADYPFATIHQTAEWGEFQSSIPSRGKYWIIILEKDNKIVGGTLLVRHKMGKGFCWLYTPRGPLINFEDSEHSEKLLSAIKAIATQEKAIFLRIDPPTNEKIKLKDFQEVNWGFQPEHTLILDLTKSEENLLSEMKPKGRYNIKLAEKKGVKIRKADLANPQQFQKDIDGYYRLLQETTQRDKFSAHPKEFYQNLLTHLRDNAALYLAEYEGEIIAAAIITYFQDTVTYYYGVSGNQHRNLMAPYLLHWKIIQEAKQNGYKVYDFFGIAPADAKNHPWQGVTEFKQKFGGHEISYPKAQEYPFRKIIYSLYRLRKNLKN